MKGLMLFFVMFGLFFTLGDNGDATPQVIEQPSLFEEVKPEVEEKKEEQQVVVQPETQELTDPVIYQDATYTAEIERICDVNQAREVPLYVKDGFVYYYTQEWNGSAYDLCLTKAPVDSSDPDSGKKSDEVLLFRNDPAGISTYYVYPANDGGYIGIGNSWDNGSYVEYLLKYDKTGKMIKKKNLSEAYKVDFNSTYFDGVTSDGTNLYVKYEGYSDSKSFGGVLKFDGNFESGEEVFDAEWAQCCVGNDKLLYVVDGYTGELWSYNPKTGAKTNLGQDDTYSYYVYPGQDNEILFGYEKLYSLNTKTNEIVELFDFEELGIEIELCDLIYRDSEGNIVLLYANYEESKSGIFKAVVKRK